MPISTETREVLQQWLTLDISLVEDSEGLKRAFEADVPRTSFISEGVLVSVHRSKEAVTQAIIRLMPAEGEALEKQQIIAGIQAILEALTPSIADLTGSIADLTGLTSGLEQVFEAPVGLGEPLTRRQIQDGLIRTVGNFLDPYLRGMAVQIQKDLPLIEQYPFLQHLYMPDIHALPFHLLIRGTKRLWSQDPRQPATIEAIWVGSEGSPDRRLRITGKSYYIDPSARSSASPSPVPMEVSVRYDVNPTTGKVVCSGLQLPDCEAVGSVCSDMTPTQLEAGYIAAAHEHSRTAGDQTLRETSVSGSSEDFAFKARHRITALLLVQSQWIQARAQQEKLQKEIHALKAKFDNNHTRYIDHQNPKYDWQSVREGLVSVTAERWGRRVGIGVGIALGIGAAIAVGVLSGGIGFLALPLVLGLAVIAVLTGLIVAQLVRVGIDKIQQHALKSDISKHEKQLESVSKRVEGLEASRTELMSEIGQEDRARSPAAPRRLSVSGLMPSSVVREQPQPPAPALAGDFRPGSDAVETDRSPRSSSRSSSGGT
jgi:cell division protein FtsB